MSIKTWEVVIKGASAAAALTAVIYGIYQYFDQRGAQIENTRLEIVQNALENDALVRESKMVFLNKQFDLYVEAVTVVSKLATSLKYEGRDADLDRFWLLYWGELAMVEGPKVAEAMWEVGNILKTIETSDSPVETRRTLEQASLKLSHCVSKSLEESWGFELATGKCD